MVRNWKMLLGGACAGLLFLSGCTTALTADDRAKLDEAIASSVQASQAAQDAKSAAERAEAAVKAAEAAAAAARTNAQASQKAFEAGLRK